MAVVPPGAAVHAPSPQPIYERLGQELTAHVFLPADWKATDRRPAYLWLHGGGFVVGSPEAGYDVAEVVAARGIVGISVQYRLAVLDVPGIGTLKATMINAGIPTVFINAAEIGCTGTELREAINTDPVALARFETIRAYGALRMGLIKDLSEAGQRQHTPKVAFVAPPADYTASSGKAITASEIDLNVRALSMGKLHHAMMGTCAVAIATAAAVPGTLVNLAAGGGDRTAVRFGHPSGTLRVGAEATLEGGQWVVKKAIMSRSARVLMSGFVHLPGDAF